MKFKTLLLSTFIISILTSCSIEKRVVKKGYHVIWEKKEINNNIELNYIESSSVQNPHNYTSIEINDGNFKGNTKDNLQFNSDTEYAERLEESKDFKGTLTADIIKYENPKIIKIFKNHEHKETLKDSTTFKQEEKLKTPGIAIAGFICAIISVPTSILLVGIIFSILSIIFALKSLKKIKLNPEKYKGKILSLTSLILGIIVSIVIGFWIIMLGFLNSGDFII